MTAVQERELKQLAAEIRIGTLEAIRARGFGHVGGSLSIAETLAVLYGAVMKVDPARPNWPERDKLVCSKGHAGPAVYAALARKGFFPWERLQTLNQPGTSLPSHCDHRKTPGVDITTGSLGQGASLAVGLALGDMLLGRDCRTFLIVGDGELNEGQVWEAAMFTTAKQVTNLIWLVDWNKRQLDGETASVLNTPDLEERFRAFGFDASTVDGHDVKTLYSALMQRAEKKPRAVILDTIKGRGVAEIETSASNHSITADAAAFDRWISEVRTSLNGEEYEL